MAAEDEEWSDCEENTIIVEIQGIIEPDFLSKVEKARVLGIDTENPYLQLEDNTFSGTYQDTMGTCLLFKDITEEQEDTWEETDKVEEKLEFTCKCCKKLCMQRMFIKANTDTKKTEGTVLHSQENSTIKSNEKNEDCGKDKDCDKDRSASDQSERVNITSDQIEGANITSDLIEGANITSDCIEGANITSDQIEGANITSDLIEGANITSDQVEVLPVQTMSQNENNTVPKSSSTDKKTILENT